MNVYDALALKAQGQMSRQEFGQNLKEEMFDNTHQVEDFDKYIY